MKKTGVFLLLFYILSLQAQDTPRVGFSPPFDFPMVLSGNFGEIRSNHFHGGIDVKTQGVSGKRLLALANGYISRIQITHGSGYVLHIKYDNGFTTINRHLSGFVGDVAQLAKETQYANESWEIDIQPEADAYPVKRGEQVAWSGNTGYSFGPHLHLDVIEDASGDYIDGLHFYQKKIKDSRKPQAQGFMVFPQKGKGVVEGSDIPKKYPVNTQSITAWGEIGLAIRAFDYMDNTTNNYGVHTAILEVDSQEVFKSVVDRFSSEENRMINSWAYDKYMKSFIEPGNSLRMLEAKNDNNGLLTIDEEKDYSIVYTLIDLYGNTSRYRFTIRGKEQEIPPITTRDKYYAQWNKTYYLQEPGFELTLPKGLLYDDLYLDVQISPDSNFVSYVYKLAPEVIPLHSWGIMKIGIRTDWMKDTQKYYVVGINKKNKTYPIGGIYVDGYMETKVRELGTYTVAIDSIAPVITILNKAGWSSGTLRLKVKDEESGIKSYKGTVDGKYVPFGLQIMSDQLVVKLDSKVIEREKNHKLEITVTDNCNNSSILTENFYW